ncbi:MAG TPA: bifunctional glutamate N-acetyltransferase/amino-acid acetyltransferase ArgJ [Candidatus Omnitrophota bacterium]|nr:bifunctional glutamate N-acetyltransferase/amino-acid acetyltransferase ArgJ [Candidatus Omnitrophota bacterium]HQO58769.1 bifunctional glutamate N-acetyltransferase/amino-acid acetyltransferase ArgJ [Candidatus Omnitrophota bacterium]
MKILKGGVTKPQGFKANGMNCGLKRSGKPDLALIASEVPCTAAGIYTRNSIIAAPLVVTKSHLRNAQAQAVIINSGNANCFTGHLGYIYAQQMAEFTARKLGISNTDVLVASTGIIGKPLPIKKILTAIPALAEKLSVRNGALAARSILTTDTFTKETAVSLSIGGKTVTIGACAKGSGMIEPNMATMLAFITTDAAMKPQSLKAALKNAADISFNSITVDGCMSTNDMCLVLANGLAGNRPISEGEKDFRAFSQALNYVCLQLAKMIVKDGEGATKFIEITVTGARDDRMAKTAAMKIANSNLVKTAAFGSNPNWGRVAAAVGSLSLPVTEQTLKIKFSPFDKKDIRISVDLQLGKHSATVYTSDLSYEYVRINGDYT